MRHLFFKSISAFAFSALCLLNQASAFAPSLTPSEQAAHISAHEIKFGSTVSQDVTKINVDRAMQLVRDLDALPGSFGDLKKEGHFTAGDGARKGNKIFRRLLGDILSQVQGGASPERVVDTLLEASPNRVLRRQSLLREISEAKVRGYDTASNLERLRQGLSPSVTKGDPKYVGQRAHVDHIVPCKKYPMLENELGNLQMTPQSLNLEKSDHVSFVEQHHAEKLRKAAVMEVGVAGLATFGFGFYIFSNEAPEAFKAWQSIWRAQGSDALDVLSAGRHSAFAISGLGGMTTGGANLCTLFVNNKSTLESLGKVSLWGKNVGTVGFLVGEGFLIAEWQSGTLNNREFVTSQASMAGGLAGAWIGAEAGAATGAGIGVWFGVWGAAPGAAIGGVVGSIGGAIGGAAIGGWVASSAFNRLDEGQKLELAAYVRAQYQEAQ